MVSWTTMAGRHGRAGPERSSCCPVLRGESAILGASAVSARLRPAGAKDDDPLPHRGRGFFRHAARLRDLGKRFFDDAEAFVEHGGVAAFDPLLIGLLHGCLHLTPALSPERRGSQDAFLTQESRRVAVRLKTGAPGFESFKSAMK